MFLTFSLLTKAISPLNYISRKTPGCTCLISEPDPRIECLVPRLVHAIISDMMFHYKPHPNHINLCIAYG